MKYVTQRKNTSAGGFTLIEILTTIALFTLLASITIIAINPQEHLADSRNVEREAHVYSIAQALYQYAADNDGEMPSGVTTEEKEVCRTDAEDCEGLYDLSILTTNESYLVTMPSDPQCDIVDGVCVTNGTGYFLSKTANGRIKIRASSSESVVIEVTQ